MIVVCQRDSDVPAWLQAIARRHLDLLAVEILVDLRPVLTHIETFGVQEQIAIG